MQTILYKIYKIINKIKNTHQTKNTEINRNQNRIINREMKITSSREQWNK